MKKATLIVIEGADKLGKETQTKLLYQELRHRGFRVARVEVPVMDSLTYKTIYYMLKKGLARKHPNMFQFVQFANKLKFQSFTLPKLLKDNDYVILDRWSLSSVIYGGLDNANDLLTDMMHGMLKKPDYTIVFHGKKHSDRVDDEYEKDSVFQERVANAYHLWALKHPIDHGIVNCEGTRIAVHTRVLDLLDDAGVL